MRTRRSKFVRFVSYIQKGRIDKLVQLLHITKSKAGLTLFLVGVILVLVKPVYIKTQNIQASPVVQEEYVEKEATVSGQIEIGPIRPDYVLFTAEIKEEEIPTRIVIPSLSLDLPITPSKVVNNTWETSEKTASFGLGSTPPGKVGNTVIFAHARDSLFGKLRKVKKDDVIYVFTRGAWFSYKAQEFKTVKSTEIEIIAPTTTETLTLYTCTGFADTKRFIVRAQRIY